jgi:uncharacterized membrane protein SpoIIM required for sporulation
MLPELILQEERMDNLPVLFLLGLISALIGFKAAEFLFPSEVSVLAVVFASIPLVYPLVTKFLDDEKGEDESYFEEVSIYGMLFLGETVGFSIVSYLNPKIFSLQAGVAGISGKATSPDFFVQILANNLMVFSAILLVSAIIGSAGAVILVWNASVLGKFFSTLIKRLEGAEVVTGGLNTPSPLAYVPHATFEMTGFIIAGVTGSVISAAVYRRHFDWRTWDHIIKLAVLGILCIIIGAMLEAT